MDASGNKVILNVVSDALLVDSYASRLDGLEGYTTRYLYRQPMKNGYEFKIVKHQVTVAKTWEEWGGFFSDPTVDIVYYHGMGNKSFMSYKYIHPNAKLIWFPYGSELYNANLYCSQLLKINLYKPLTKRFIPCAVYRLLTIIANVVGRFRYDRHRERWISRVDYCSTVLPYEYDMLCEQLSFFDAKPFMLRTMRGYSDTPLVVNTERGNILLNHSAVFHDNHIDIIHQLESFDLHDRQIVMPISYGNKFLMKQLKKYHTIGGAKVMSMNRILPKQEYFTLIDSCTHAIFGTIRQCAIGNINRCMRMGVKVFMYKDSLTYTQFKRDGYIIYTIEDDLNEASLRTPLSEEASIHNRDLFYEIQGNKSVDDVLINVKRNFDCLYK